MISAHHRAAAAFNDIVSAARIAIEALAKIAAESGRQSRSSRIHLLKSKSLSAFRNRLSGSVRPRRVAILPEGPPRARIAHIANPRSQLLQHWGSGREHRRELTPTRHPPQGSPREMRAGPPCAGIGAASAAAQRSAGLSVENLNQKGDAGYADTTSRAGNLLKRGSTGSPTTLNPMGPRSAPSARRCNDGVVLDRRASQLLQVLLKRNRAGQHNPVPASASGRVEGPAQSAQAAPSHGLITIRLSRTTGW